MVIALSGWTRRAGAPRRCWPLRGSSGQSRRLHRLWRSLAGGDRRAPSFRSSDGQREARSNRGGRRYPPCRGPNKMDKILFVYRKKPQGVSGCSSGIPSADSPLRVGRSVHIPRTRARQTSVARRPLRPARETRPSALDALVQDRLFGTMPPEGIALRLPSKLSRLRTRHGRGGWRLEANAAFTSSGALARAASRQQASFTPEETWDHPGFARLGAELAPRSSVGRGRTREGISPFVGTV